MPLDQYGFPRNFFKTLSFRLANLYHKACGKLKIIQTITFSYFYIFAYFINILLIIFVWFWNQSELLYLAKAYSHVLVLTFLNYILKISYPERYLTISIFIWFFFGQSTQSASWYRTQYTIFRHLTELVSAMENKFRNTNNKTRCFHVPNIDKN
jgi:hypothetical protein